MIGNEIILNEDNLFLVDGFDDKKYIIKIEANGGFEVSVKPDTYETIKKSVRNRIPVNQAFNSVVLTRDSSIIKKEIEKLIEKKVISFS